MIADGPKMIISSGTLGVALCLLRSGDYETIVNTLSFVAVFVNKETVSSVSRSIPMFLRLL